MKSALTFLKVFGLYFLLSCALLGFSPILLPLLRLFSFDPYPSYSVNFIHGIILVVAGALSVGLGYLLYGKSVNDEKFEKYATFCGVVFISLCIQGLVQFSTPFFADSNDSFYHAKMAQMILDNGIVQQFPWLYFTTLNQNFVDHHFLFHVILIPFIQIGKLFTPGDVNAGIILGAKSAIVLAISLFTGAFYLLLHHFKVRIWPVWIMLLLAVPYDFFFRMHMVRVQSISLLVMLLGLWALFEQKYKLLGVLCFLYVTLYGGFFFLPIFVGIYFVVHYIRNREFLWTPLLWAFGGMALGFLTSPYMLKTLGFLQQQVFETGLGYAKNDLNVGGEWRPYDTWYIFQMGIVTFTVQFLAITWVFIKGLKQNTKSITVFLISLFFLILMWKSKRFVEYWPAFAILSSAYLLRDEFTKISLKISHLITLTASFAALALLGNVVTSSKIFSQISTQPGSPAMKGMFAAFIFIVLFVSIGIFLYQENKKKEQKYSVFATTGLALAFVLLPMVSYQNFQLVERDISSETQPNPQSAYIRGAENIMNCILVQGQAQKGDIVMTDDWDVFPLFFFYNSVNNYILGLDPVFMYKLDKNLYTQFANITIGTERDNLPEKIKNTFKSKFIVVDKYHNSFKGNIEEYPDAFKKLCDNPEFTAYKVQ
ncbi:MAG: hypothetical protein ACK4NC_00180 [Candidatus Gracilibacteria bacterium]